MWPSAFGVEAQRLKVIGEFLESPGSLGDRFRVEVKIIVWQAPGPGRKGKGLTGAISGRPLSTDGANGYPQRWRNPPRNPVGRIHA